MNLSDSETLHQGWYLRSIDDVCQRVTSGGTPSRKSPEFYVDGVWPWVKTQELRDCWLRDTEEHITEEAVQHSSAKILPTNTVLLAMYGATVGKLALLSREMTCNQACCALIVDNALANYRFIYYALLNARPKLANLAVGAAQQNLSAATIKSLRFAFPPLDEQRAIASVLGALDDKIELNRKMSATLEAIARALFKSWFVNFDPVRAKAEGRDPGVPPEIAALFPDSFEKSELGEIPKGWQVQTLGQLLTTVECGSRPKGGVSAYRSGIPSVGAESIIGVGVFDFTKTKFVPLEFYESMRRGHCRPWDVLLYKDGGKPGNYEPHVTLVGTGFPFSEFCINEHVYRLRADGTIGQTYLYLSLTHDATMEALRQKGTGVAVPGLNSTALSSVVVQRPNDDVINAFEAIAKPLLRSILLHAAQSRTLATLRDALLPKLISGEIHVRDAECLVGKSA